MVSTISRFKKYVREKLEWKLWQSSETVNARAIFFVNEAWEIRNLMHLFVLQATGIF